MMVYHGTRLHDRMRDEGRLLGNPLRYGYSFEDPAVERFAEIFTRLRGEAFWDYSVAYRTHDAYLALSLGRRLEPGRPRAGIPSELERVRRALRDLYLGTYRSALDLALSGGGFAEATPLVMAARERALEIGAELDDIEETLLRAAPEGARMFSPMRSAAARVFSFAVLLPLAACGGKVVFNAGATGTSLDGGAGGAGPHDGGAGGSGGSGGAPVCTDADVAAATAAVKATLAASDACFNGSVAFTPGAQPAPSFNFNGMSGSFGVGACPTAADQAATLAAQKAASAALAGKVPACITKDGMPTFVPIDGGAHSDAQKLSDTVAAACGTLLGGMGQFKIVLDAAGKVVDVVPADPSAAELASCVKAALAGLAFPCLASFEVCPEYVIAE
jgi:hypothetical protein